MMVERNRRRSGRERAIIIHLSTCASRSLPCRCCAPWLFSLSRFFPWIFYLHRPLLQVLLRRLRFLRIAIPKPSHELEWSWGSDCGRQRDDAAPRRAFFFFACSMRCSCFPPVGRKEEKKREHAIVFFISFFPATQFPRGSLDQMQTLKATRSDFDRQSTSFCDCSRRNRDIARIELRSFRHFRSHRVIETTSLSFRKKNNRQSATTERKKETTSERESAKER